MKKYAIIEYSIDGALVLYRTNSKRKALKNFKYYKDELTSAAKSSWIESQRVSIGLVRALKEAA